MVKTSELVKNTIPGAVGGAVFGSFLGVAGSITGAAIVIIIGVINSRTLDSRINLKHTSKAS